MIETAEANTPTPPSPLPVILDGQDKRRMHELANALRDSGWPDVANAIHTFVAQQNLAASSHALAALRTVPTEVLANIPASQPSKPMSDAQVEIARKLAEDCQQLGKSREVVFARLPRNGGGQRLIAAFRQADTSLRVDSSTSSLLIPLRLTSQ